MLVDAFWQEVWCNRNAAQGAGKCNVGDLDAFKVQGRQLQ